MTADQFLERLMASTRSLVQNNGAMTNAEYFIKCFAKGLEDRQNDLWARFMRFYETEYDKLEISPTRPNLLHDTMDKIVRTGLKLVLASNPLFPLNVQMKRLSWAGLGHLRFNLVTHLENMSYCKPRIEYYREICTKIDAPPAACLMVGNDPVNDMIAARIGMKTYLTDDSKDDYRVTERKKRVLERFQITEIPDPDFTGPLSEVPRAVQHLITPL